MPTKVRGRSTVSRQPEDEKRLQRDVLSYLGQLLKYPVAVEKVRSQHIFSAVSNPAEFFFSPFG
jgi:hypothetical protein